MALTASWYLHALLLLLASSAASASESSARSALIKGVSYGPVPLKSMDGAAQLPADDWFSAEAVPLWGKSGRGDLKVMKQLGANMVRLYGNNPATDHTNFLDEAQSEGLRVAPGMSDFPYYQDRDGNCQHDTDYDCFSQVKPLYAHNLQKGFLTMKQEYHPALKYMNIINEPDLKMPSGATAGVVQLKQMCKSIISALDAMLDAEKDAGVVGPLINFTATFSYATCTACSRFSGKPALGQMAQLDDAMRDPAKYGYAPRNNVTAAYETRFTHSFNTQNPATDLQQQFLDDYMRTFPTTPVYIAEYHRVGANQTEDLSTIMDIATTYPLFLGISFFQYQVAYWKFGPERDFGMFGLGDFVFTNMSYFSKTYPVYCLVPVESNETGMPLPSALSGVYGGPGVEAVDLCVPSPWGVPLDEYGFAEIASQQRASQMEIFVQRVALHLGATVREGQESALSSFASGFVGGSSDGFETMASVVGSRPTWLEFDPEARCISNRGATPALIGAAIGWACANSPSLNCSVLPDGCATDPYRVGDYVLSHYYSRHGDISNPLLGCDFGGAGIFAPRKLYETWTGASLCAGALTTTITSSTSTGTSTTRTTTSTSVTSTTSTIDEPQRHDDVIAPSPAPSPQPSFLGTSQRGAVLFWCLPLGLVAVSLVSAHM